MKFLPIIPARGGSKGLPKKNITTFYGKPLIAYTIEAALQSKTLTECFVTSDCSDILDMANTLGARTIVRPDALATDTAQTYDALKHVTENIPNFASYTHIMVLQPTSPLRNAQHIDEAVDLFKQSNSACLVSVTHPCHHPYKDFVMKDETHIMPLFGLEYVSAPRQHLPQVLRQNGAIYIISVEKFFEAQAFIAEPCIPYLMSKETSVDIDTFVDLALAKIFHEQSLEKVSA